jgi:hypothetical protein
LEITRQKQQQAEALAAVDEGGGEAAAVAHLELEPASSVQTPGRTNARTAAVAQQLKQRAVALSAVAFPSAPFFDSVCTLQLQAELPRSDALDDGVRAAVVDELSDKMAAASKGMRQG